MSTSDPIAPERLEALLRGEAGTDGRERRIGALLDELTLGEIAPPAELRERVRSLSAAPVAVAATPRRLPRLRVRRPRRLVPALGGALAVFAVIAGVAVTQTRTPDHTVPLSAPNVKASAHELQPVVDAQGVAARAAVVPTSPTSTGQNAFAPPSATSGAPLPDGQRAQDYSASLRLAVGTVAEL